MRSIWFSQTCFLVISSLFFAGIATAGEVREGGKVSIITPETAARLCPYPNCGQDQHIARIPQNTVLEVEGVTTIKSGIMSVKWFEVSYKGKRGWISIYDTDKAD